MEVGSSGEGHSFEKGYSSGEEEHSIEEKGRSFVERDHSSREKDRSFEEGHLSRMTLGSTGGDRNAQECK